MNKNISDEVLNRLGNTYEDYPKTGLKNWNNDWQLLFSIILSAQANDDQVNKVTKELYKKYTALDSIANEEIDHFKEEIRSLGFFNVKAKYLIDASNMILKDYEGKVPSELRELIKIPGVGRKSANVFQGVLFGKSEGIAVDTHVLRMSRRLGFTKNKTADKVEEDLIKIFKKEDYHMINPILFWHGRTICKAKKPVCEKCSISDICPSAFNPI